LPTIGLALGSGASRGWAHIGIIRALEDAGVVPNVICGTSVGAMVGASYAAGNLQVLTDWVLNSTRTDVLRFFDLKPGQAGFVDTSRFSQFLYHCVAAEDLRVEDLDKAYGAIATDLDTGREIWLREGLLADAVRASMAMPGLFPPVAQGRRWLVDGGLVNPVPVSTCHALGAEIVIAVNLNADIVGRRRRRAEAATAQADASVLANLKKQAKEYSDFLFSKDNDEEPKPGLIYAISSAVNIFEDRITRSRLVGDPADVILSPKVGDIGILEFQRAHEAIEKGREAVQDALHDIRRAAGLGVR
jgi:NTE family protein